MALASTVGSSFWEPLTVMSDMASTAATIWCVAAIGAQAGAEETVAAIWLTAVVLAVNLVLKPTQRLIRRTRPRHPSAEDVALES